eukprot:TRINITY_DN4085_c0_g1_i1.p1 TRINITY_DN4085_c0_g1~~TRINITY_DN4085_c0_g1_i1.p1  ORF type:complete len:370 (+),score=51.63 TRINITY_DN4085_c0_g1_i1:742-1851(+)
MLTRKACIPCAKFCRLASNNVAKAQNFPGVLHSPPQGFVYGLNKEEQRTKAEWFKPASYTDEHDTTRLFHRRVRRRAQIFESFDARNGLEFPPVPSQDWRTLSNKEWAESQQIQSLVRDFSRKHEVIPNIFPECGFSVNLQVQFPEAHWDAVYCGNFITLDKALQQPAVIIPKDGLGQSDRYTLFMFCPDFPFRSDPEDGHLLHWVVANLQPGQEASGDTLVDYLHPIPTEYAGAFRYVFVLFKQKEGHISFPTGLAMPGEHYSLEARRNFFLNALRPTSLVQDRSLAHLTPQLEPVPTAVSFFHTRYQWHVSEYYRKNKLKEPIFTPSDIIENHPFYAKHVALWGGVPSFHKRVDWKAIVPKAKPHHQ